jgi:hypothetical protein
MSNVWLASSVWLALALAAYGYILSQRPLNRRKCREG